MTIVYLLLCILLVGCGGRDVSEMRVHNRLGFTYLMAGKYGKALVEYRKVVEMAPKSPDARRNLGLAYANVLQINAAVAEYERALELDPNLATAHNDLGVICFKTEGHRGAEEAFQRALDIAPSEKLFRYNLGALYHLVGQYDAAARMFGEVIEQDPNSALMYYSLGVVRAKQNRQDEAMELFTKALKINPNHPETHYELALVYSRLGYYADAEGEHRKALAIDPNHSGAHYGLSKVYLRVGREAEAAVERAAFERLGTHKKAKYIFFAPPETEIRPRVKRARRPSPGAPRPLVRAERRETAREEETVQFVDVSEEAGIRFMHTTGASGRYYYVETTGGPGVAFFDYDNDGDLDAYLVNGADLPGVTPERPPTNVLYRNNGDGTFTDVTESAGVGDTGYGMGCAVADYDNDGDRDLYVTNFGPNVFYRNNGDGTFTDVTESAGVGDSLWGASCAFADYDDDGYVDLYVANYVAFSLDQNEVCTYGGIRSYCHPGTYPGVSDVLYHNDGDGTFTDVTEEAGVYDPGGKGLGVVFGDYDDDGDVDLYVANDETPNFLYCNNGDGVFTEVGFLAGVACSENGEMESGMGTDFGDYDNDGDLDLFVNNYSFETSTLYRNDGDGFFADATVAAGLGDITLLPLVFGTDFFDYDHDGDLDLFLAAGHILDNVQLIKGEILSFAQKNLLFRNDGGRYTDVSEQSGPGFALEKVSRSSAVGDYDNDGDLDILVGNCGGTATLLRNEGGNRNNYLMLHLLGTTSNRDGIGARITVTSESLSQVEEVRSGSGYASCNDLRVHFGLGKRRKADRIEIRWPSGYVQDLRDVPVNRVIVVREGQTL